MRMSIFAAALMIAGSAQVAHAFTGLEFVRTRYEGCWVLQHNDHSNTNRHVRGYAVFKGTNCPAYSVTSAPAVVVRNVFLARDAGWFCILSDEPSLNGIEINPFTSENRFATSGTCSGRAIPVQPFARKKTASR